MMDASEIYALFEARRKELGLSQAEVGMLAFNKADNAALQNIKKGSSPSIERVSAIARALGLDLYLGEQKQAEAALADMKAYFSQPAILGRLMSQYGPHKTVQEIIEDEGYGDATVADMFARFEGEESARVKIDLAAYAIIPLHEAWLSAGPGIANTGANIVDHLAFRRDWLARIGVAASQCCLARVTGDSMFPTLSPGDMVLLDTAKTNPPTRTRNPADRRRPAIWALLEDGEARIKRIERPDSTTMMLLSDNPDHPPELRQGQRLATLQVIGKVVWWGHTSAS